MWYENGQLEVQSFWMNGKRKEKYKRWHENGRPWVHAFYQNGKLEGKCKEWYENGQLAEHIFYRDGRPEGERKVWSNDGIMSSYTYYENGGIVDPIFSLRKKCVILRLQKCLYSRHSISAISLYIVSDLIRTI